MKKVLSFVFALGLTMAIYGQVTIATAPTQADCAPAPVLETQRLEVGMTKPGGLPGGGSEVGTRVLAKGGVVIRIGSNLITADEAEIRRGAGPDEPSDVELRGNVHLKSVLMVR